MRVKILAAGLALMLGLALVSGGSARAEDRRLNLPATSLNTGSSLGGSTRTLTATEEDLVDDVEQAYWRGGWGGGYRGYWGGYRGGWGVGYRGYWGGGWGGGYRGHWGGAWGGYRPLYGWGGYRPYWGGGYYQPYYNTWNYYRPYTYYGGYYNYGGVSYYRLSLDCTPVTTVIPMTMPRATEPGSVLPAPSTELRTLPPAKGGATTTPPPAGTFQYDGGPKDVVPMPRPDETNPAPLPAPAQLRRPMIVEDLLVAEKAAEKSTNSGKWSFPAYGEVPRRTGGTDRVLELPKR